MATKLYSYIQTDDNDNLDVPFMDKIVAYIFQWFRESGREDIENDKLDDLVTTEMLTLQADLINFIDTALLPIKQGKHKQVILKIDSKFVPVLEYVISSPYYTDYYKVTPLKWEKMDYNIPYFVLIQLEAK